MPEYLGIQARLATPASAAIVRVPAGAELQRISGGHDLRCLPIFGDICSTYFSDHSSKKEGDGKVAPSVKRRREEERGGRIARRVGGIRTSWGLVSIAVLRGPVPSRQESLGI